MRVASSGQLLAAQDEVDADENELQLRLPEMSHAIVRDRTVDRDDLRHVGDRLSRQAGSARRQQEVSPRGCPAEVACQRHDDSRRKPACIERVPWTTSTGRRNPGSEPVWFGSDAQQMSPWRTTNRCARESRVRPQPTSAPDRRESRRRHRRARPSPTSSPAVPHSQREPPGRPGSSTFRAAAPAPPPDGRGDPESRQPFSYREYHRSPWSCSTVGAQSRFAKAPPRRAAGAGRSTRRGRGLSLQRSGRISGTRRGPCSRPSRGRDASEQHRDHVEELTRRVVARRQEVCVERQIGLTKLYNQVEEGAYRELADMHRGLDEAVASAYGWPASAAHDPVESNGRLLELNRQIVAGEVA